MKNNQALQSLICGLKDGGLDLVTNFPGGQSYFVFNELGGSQISMNERVAFECAVGGSLAGRRSVVTLKGAGLNACADVFLHSVLSGVNAGLVVVLFDDIEAQSSPERQDSRPYIDVFGGLWLEPTSIGEAYGFGRDAFRWSEDLDVPVVIRITNQLLQLVGEFDRLPILKNKMLLMHNRDKYISHWKRRNDNLKVKNVKIKEFIEDYYKDYNFSFGSEVGIIKVGNCQREVEKYRGTHADELVVSTYPLPEKLIYNFAKGRKKLIVLEQGVNYAETKIRSLLNNKQEFVGDTGDECDNSKEWPVFVEWEKMFLALKSISPDFVVGDEGTFTDESTKTIEFCLSMGASVGVALGLSMAGVRYPFAVVGDASFAFSGKQTLDEVIHRKKNIGIIILDNGGAKSVGGMPIIGDIYDVGKMAKKVLNYNQTSLEQFQNLFKAMKEGNKSSILYVQKK